MKYYVCSRLILDGIATVISSPVGLVPTNALAVSVGLLARSRLPSTNPEPGQITSGLPTIQEKPRLLENQ